MLWQLPPENETWYRRTNKAAELQAVSKDAQSIKAALYRGSREALDVQVFNEGANIFLGRGGERFVEKEFGELLRGVSVMPYGVRGLAADHEPFTETFDDLGIVE